MKTIKGINQQVQHFDENIPKEITAGLPTYKKMFLGALGSGTAANGEEAVEMWAIALKIRGVKDDEVSLEDSEFALLKTKCSANPVGWMAHFLAQVMLKLKEAEGVA